MSRDTFKNHLDRVWKLFRNTVVIIIMHHHINLLGYTCFIFKYFHSTTACSDLPYIISAAHGLERNMIYYTGYIRFILWAEFGQIQKSQVRKVENQTKKSLTKERRNYAQTLNIHDYYNKNTTTRLIGALYAPLVHTFHRWEDQIVDGSHAWFVWQVGRFERAHHHISEKPADGGDHLGDHESTLTADHCRTRKDRTNVPQRTATPTNNQSLLKRFASKQVSREWLWREKSGEKQCGWHRLWLI